MWRSDAGAPRIPCPTSAETVATRVRGKTFPRRPAGPAWWERTSPDRPPGRDDCRRRWARRGLGSGSREDVGSPRMAWALPCPQSCASWSAEVVARLTHLRISCAPMPSW